MGTWPRLPPVLSHQTARDRWLFICKCSYCTTRADINSQMIRAALYWPDGWSWLHPTMKKKERKRTHGAPSFVNTIALRFYLVANQLFLTCWSMYLTEICYFNFLIFAVIIKYFWTVICGEEQCSSNNNNTCQKNNNYCFCSLDKPSHKY